MRNARAAARSSAGALLKVLRGAALLAAAFALRPDIALAADDGILSRGDAAVTQFSGARTSAKVPKDLHPLDVTVIDVDGVSLEVLDLAKPGTPQAGKIADVPSKLAIKARAIGQVFGIALDSTSSSRAPNIYAGASSLYGLQIMSDKGGAPLRLVKGEPGARWMPGQFGLDKGGGPGSIWKIDGRTGEVSLFSTIATGNRENAGPGLGGLTFDPVSQRLYAANLETGEVHVLDLAGRDVALYDHGTAGRPRAGLDPVPYEGKGRMDIESPKFSVEDPQTWGYADKKRLVVALAVENDRLYYSVADGPVVWSVGLRSDGTMLEDARLEIDVTGTPNHNMITGLAFDGPQKLYLTQRGETAGSYEYATFARPQKSSVLRYSWSDKDKAWVEAPEEYAIGEEPVHRATNGGVALGYGYDESGRIDFGKCRETLWTTGEHLVSGSEQPVHGLQGQSKKDAQRATSATPKSGSTALQGDFGSVAETQLEAPGKAWFADTEGAKRTETAHGHVGAIAIYAPCDGETLASSARPLPLWPISVPPAKVPGLYIEKECFPGLFGGKITCRIRVTNIGLDPWAPVTLADATTILAGPGAGSSVPVVAFTPDGPDWFCTAVPTTAFQCMLPAGIVLPGQTRFVDVVVDTGPIAAAGNAGFRNCASLLAPFGGIACAEGGTGTSGLVIEKTGEAVCNPGAACTFALAINNTGTQPFIGNVQISDAMFVGGASVAAPITASTLNCIGGNPAALPFTCVVPANIAPAAAQTYSITITMPAAPPNYWAQNCFAAFDPAFVPPGGPFPSQGGPGGPGFGSPTNPSCIWVKAGNPPAQSNLIISKSQTGIVCDSSLGTGIASCHYEIKIKNDGPSPFNNVISINETPPVGSNLLLDPAWGCVAGPPGPPPGFTCTSPAAIALAAGQTFTVKATIQIPALLTEPTCQVQNTVAINTPLGGPLNMLAGDDAAGATHNTALIAVLNPDGTVSVACDPTNLKTEKKIEKCTASGDSTTCIYRITVSNTGPDPYKGPITIEDQLSAAPSSISFSDGWSCGGGGTSRLCTKAGVELAPPGKPGQHSVTLEVKATVPHAGKCTIWNTAHMSFPLPGTRFNLKGDDDKDTVSTPVSSPECIKRPVCEAPAEGELRSASGACVCKAGYARDKAGRCVTEEVAETPEPQAAKCPDGNPIPKNGVCPCKSGTTWNRQTNTCDGQCEPGPNEIRTSAGACVCREGYARVDDGRCVKEEERCEPGPNEVRTSKGTCVCREGYERNDDGRCVKEEERCEPGPNEVRTKDGRCVCEDGYERRDGRCVKEAPDCRKGTHLENGKCVPDSDPAGDCRRKGREWTGSRCVEPRTPAEDCKEKGGRWSDGKCTFPPGPEQLCKEKGGIWKNGQCMILPSPADICKLRGGRWDGKTCVMPPSPEELCKQKGGTWKNGQCMILPSPADICKLGGGRWDGKTCVMPPKQCPSGTTGKYPDCKKIEIKECPKGTTGKYPDCKKIETKKCPEGYQGTPPVCFKLNPPKKEEPRPSCPKGQVLIQGKCVTPS